MERAYAAQRIYDAEAPALAAGVPLMARAARALADHVLSLLDPGEGVLVVAGRGNNGGDGLYAAAHLARAGIPVAVALTADAATAEGAAEEAAAAGAKLFPAGDQALLRAQARRARVWVDALSGIGMRPPARGELAQILSRLEAMRAELPAAVSTVAVDLPSGLDASSGAITGPILRADHTVTFGGYKAAHVLPPAAHACGQIHLVDIGIGPELSRQEPAVLRAGACDIAAGWPVPGPADHKYTRGVVGMVTGSADYPGAALLSVDGALGTGPGMVRYRGDADQAVLTVHPEAVAAPGRVQAWVVGSGITGRESPAAACVQAAIEEAGREGLPLVVDAGALAWVERGSIGGSEAGERVVLTPHAGELAHLLTRLGEATSREEVEADPAAHARRAARLTGASVVVKGAITLIVSGRRLFSQADGPAWLATAGSGDVLAGVLGTVLAGWQARAEQGGRHTWPSFGHAIAAGVALHGRAGAHASRGAPIRAGQIAAALQPTIRALLAH